MFQCTPKHPLLRIQLSPTTVKAPTLILWGSEDTYCGVAMAPTCGEVCTNPPTIKVFPGVSHWITHDVPNEVNSEIESFIKKVQ